jgi:5,10-methylenetetrahydromethanopterin reductase
VDVLELGLGFQSDRSPAELAGLARAAEEAGFATVSVFNDLFYPPPIGALLAIAGATEQIRLGPACMNPYTVHPVEIAGQIGLLERASKGRAYLGIANGAWLDAVGIDQSRPVAAMREALAVIRALWAGDDSGVAGRRFSLAPGQTLRYAVARPDIPIMLGTWSPRMAALTDTVKISPTANPDLVRLMRERVDRVVVGGATVVAEDGAEARRRAATMVAMYLPVVAALDPTVGAEPELLDRIAAGSGVPDELLRRFAYAGTPHEVIEQVESLHDAGVMRVEFSNPDGFELLVRRVLPHFRRVAV